jgi:hypothetical protein
VAFPAPVRIHRLQAVCEPKFSTRIGSICPLQTHVLLCGQHQHLWASNTLQAVVSRYNPKPRLEGYKQLALSLEALTCGLVQHL